MKVITTLSVLTVLLLGVTTSANAGVAFLPEVSGSVGNSESSQHVSSSSGQKCKEAGYTLTSCSAGKIPVDRCPYAGGYYRNCCSKEYRFTKDECLDAGLRYSRSSCGGFYKCL